MSHRSDMPGPDTPRIARWAHAVIVTGILAAAVAAATVGQPYQERVLRGENDFLQLYSGAALVGSRDLYAPEAVKQLQLHEAGMWLKSVYYCRLPFYAVLLKPLALLPYPVAYWVFQTLNLLCGGLFAYLYLARRFPQYLVWFPLFFPTLISFVGGQDVMILTLFCAVFLVLSWRGRDFSAGIWLSLCLIKFHLFVFLPIALVAHRRWRTLIGAGAAGFFWLILSFGAGGLAWPARYLALLREPDFHSGLDRMPTIYAVLRSFGATASFATAMVVILGALSALCIFKTKNLDTAVGLAIIAGILLSFHSYVHDSTLLLLAIPPLAAVSGHAWAVRALLLTPIPYLASLSGKPWNVLLPAALLAFFVVTAVGATRRGHGAIGHKPQTSSDPCTA